MLGSFTAAPWLPPAQVSMAKEVMFVMVKLGRAPRLSQQQAERKPCCVRLRPLAQAPSPLPGWPSRPFAGPQHPWACSGSPRPSSKSSHVVT